VRDRLASGGQRLRLCTPLVPGAPDPDLSLGYSGRYTRRKDGPGAARPWRVQGKALAAGGDLPDFQAITVLALFSKKNERIFLPSFRFRCGHANACRVPSPLTRTWRHSPVPSRRRGASVTVDGTHRHHCRGRLSANLTNPLGCRRKLWNHHAITWKSRLHEIKKINQAGSGAPGQKRHFQSFES
jgi:hypothetical protein